MNLDALMRAKGIMDALNIPRDGMWAVTEDGMYKMTDSGWVKVEDFSGLKGREISGFWIDEAEDGQS